MKKGITRILFPGGTLLKFTSPLEAKSMLSKAEIINWNEWVDGLTDEWGE